VELVSSTHLTVWPIGWHDEAVVLAVGPPYVQNMPNLYGASRGFQVVNATTGQRLASLCPNAPATGPLGMVVPSGIVCPKQEDLYVQDWSGRARLFYHAPGGTGPALYVAALALDGSRLAISPCSSKGESCPQPGVLLVDAHGQRTLITLREAALAGTTLEPKGWLSATHLVLQSTQSSQTGMPLYILDLRSRVLWPLAAGMPNHLVAVLPGGLDSLSH
jgi:hypothetical protein